MSNFVASEMRFAGALDPQTAPGAGDPAGTVTFDGTGEQVTIPVNTAWSVVFFQAHSVSAGAGAANAILTNLSTSDVYARIVMTGQGSFAIDNNGREISPVIKSTNGSITLTCQVAGTNTEQYCCGANLEQVYAEPSVA